MGMLSYLSFSQTCESLPRPYLCFLPPDENPHLWFGEMKMDTALPSDVLGSVWGLQQGALPVGSLMTFRVILGFGGLRLVVPDPEPCLAIPLCGFRFKLAINAVLLSEHQHACHAENIAGLEWSQT